MTDHDKNNHPEAPQIGSGAANDRINRANQDAASRPGVDADNDVDHDGNPTSDSHEGSTYQPLRMDSTRGSGEAAERSNDTSGYVQQQDQNQNAGGHEGVSRGGAVTQHGDAIRESQSAPGGGSVFQPLEADPSHVEDMDQMQRGNPAGQNQQGLNEASSNEGGTIERGQSDGGANNGGQNDGGSNEGGPDMREPHLNAQNDQNRERRPDKEEPRGTAPNLG